MEVTDRRTEVVRPELPGMEEAPELRLSALDSATPAVYIPLVYAYAGEGDGEVMPQGRVQSALLSALRECPDLCRRPVRSADGHCCLAAGSVGFEFTSAVGNFTIGDLEAAEYDPLLLPLELLPGSPMAAEEFALKVQMTRLRDSSLVLAALLHHRVVDAEGAFAFVRRWAEICASLKEATPEEAVEAAAAAPDGRYDELVVATPPAASATSEAPASYSMPSFTSRLLHLSEATLSRLKDAADADGGVACSRNDCAMALLWRRLTEARRLPPDTVTRCGLVCNVRRRLRLPSGYVGNCGVYIVEQATVAELLSLPLAQLARRFRRCVAQRTAPGHLRSLLRSVEALPDKAAALPNLRWYGTDLLVSSWAAFAVYDGADFGCGRPRRFLQPARGHDTVVTLLPRHDGDGIEAFVGLNEEAMRRLGDLPEPQI